MTDVLTNALQKLASGKTSLTPCAPVQQCGPVDQCTATANTAVCHSEVTIEAASASTIQTADAPEPLTVVETTPVVAVIQNDEPPVSIPSPPPIESLQTLLEPVSSNAIESPAPVPLELPSNPSAWQRATAAVLANRRQTAAVIVLLCMGYLWFEETPKPPSSDWTGNTDIDFSDIDAMASAFDSADSGPTREPAEPQGLAAGEFQLTIPPEQNDVFQTFENTSPSSTAVAVYPDDPNSAGDSMNGSFTIPNTTQPTPSQTPSNTGKRVRFTGGIQRAY